MIFGQPSWECIEFITLSLRQESGRSPNMSIEEVEESLPTSGVERRRGIGGRERRWSLTKEKKVAQVFIV